MEAHKTVIGPSRLHRTNSKSPRAHAVDKFDIGPDRSEFQFRIPGTGENRQRTDRLEQGG